MILKRKSEKDNDPKNKTLDDIKYVALGTGSGAIVGRELAKGLNNIINRGDLEDHLLQNSEPEQAKYLLSLKDSSSRKARRRYKQIMDEAAERANPEVKKALAKKGTLIGTGVGLLISGAGLTAKKLREKKAKEKSFSDEKLPSDWGETDDKYVKLVEKGIKRSEKLSNLDKVMKQSYAKGGALIGAYLGFRRGKLHRPPKVKGGILLLGDKTKRNLLKEHPEILRTIKGSAEGALGGLGLATLSSQIYDITGKHNEIKNLGERERTEARRIIKRYKKMETSEERKNFRKKIGVKF